MEINITIDAGNAYIKVGVWKKGLQKRCFKNWKEATAFVNKQNADHLLLSLVREISTKEWAALKAKKKWQLNHTLALPISLNYKTPHTLGADRIAAACGAGYLFPQKKCLIIDIGTCVTYDFISTNGKFSGGAISPGMHLRFRALHLYTARLPLISNTKNPPLTGTSTADSIRSGVVNGMNAEVNGFISLYEKKYPDLQVIVCGGDRKLITFTHPEKIHFCETLVLEGLRTIIEHLRKS